MHTVSGQRQPIPGKLKVSFALLALAALLGIALVVAPVVLAVQSRTATATTP